MTDIQPSLRAENIHICTKDICPTQTHPRVVGNLCATGYKMTGKHITLGRYDLGEQTERGWMEADSFLNHSLEVGERFTLVGGDRSGDGAVGDALVDLLLETAVDMGSGGDVA